MTKPIVVGTDGSAEALRAVHWAATEAACRGLPLRIVNAMLHWAYASPTRPPPLSGLPDPAAHAREVVEEAARAAAVAAPEVTANTSVVEGEAAAVLRDTAADAEMVVIGNRGLGGFTGLLLGSVGYTLAGRTPCPLVVVRADHATSRREVVIGVDGMPGGEPVLEFGFATADLWRARVRALHAWTRPTSRGPGDMLPLVYDVDEVAQEESRLLAESIAGLRTRHPDVDVIEDTVRAPAARALVDASADADLVVIGPHHPRLRSPAGLGSVAHAVVHHAHCPVAVAPRPPRRDGGA